MQETGRVPGYGAGFNAGVMALQSSLNRRRDPALSKQVKPLRSVTQASK